MKTHLQPITARVTSTIKKSSDCGCSPTKNLAYAAKKAANKGDETFEYAGQTFNTTAKADSTVKKYSGE